MRELFFVSGFTNPVNYHHYSIHKQIKLYWVTYMQYNSCYLCFILKPISSQAFIDSNIPFLPSFLKRTSLRKRPRIMQWPRIRINKMEYEHHNHRTNEHRNRPKKPQKQIESEIEGSKAKRPEIISPYHCRLHTTHWYVTIWCAYEICCVNKMPHWLNKAWESKQETE